MKRYFCFADISNFTSTTEIFINQSKYGSERIRDLVDSIFSKSTDFIYRKGGQVLLFAGDGLLFYLNDEKDISSLHDRMRKDSYAYNTQYGTSLDVKMLKFDEEMRAQVISLKKGEFVYFHPEDSGLDVVEVKERLNMSHIERLSEYRSDKHPGELRTLPISFIHIDGFLTPSNLNPFFMKIIEKSASLGVYVNKIEWADKGWMILLSCGAPFPVENAPAAMLDFLSFALTEAEKSGFSIHTGATLRKGYSGIIGTDERWEYTFFGANVNLAARIAHSAPAGSIVCDYGFAKEAEKYAEFDFLESKKFKGISGETDIYRYAGRKSYEETEVFIGREPEIKELTEHMKGRLKAALLSGEAGIGKSSILKEFMKEARSVIYVKAPSDGGPMSLIEKINGELSKLIPGIKEKNEKEKFIKYCSLPGAPVLNAVIDDAQNADELSLEAIRYIFMEGGKNVNFLFSTRRDDVFRFTESRLSKYDLLNLKISGMGRGEIGMMLKEYGRGEPDEKDVDALLKISGGNPLYAVQMINYMLRESMLSNEGGRLKANRDISSFPYSLQELLFLKIDNLGKEAKNVIEIGAVRGNEFENRLIEEVMKGVEGGIGELLKEPYEMKILNRKAEKITVFYHSLVRQSVYDRMLKKRIESIAEKIADFFASDAKNPESLRTAGDFYLLKGDEKAADCYIESAKILLKKKNMKKSSFSLEKYFKCPYDAGRLKEACKYAYTILTSNPEMSFIYAVYGKLKLQNDPDYQAVLCLYECCTFFVWRYRDREAAYGAAAAIKRHSGKDTEFETMMSDALYLRSIEKSRDAFEIYLSLLKKIEKSGEKRVITLTAVLSLVFFEFSSLKLTEKYMKELDIQASKVKRTEVLLDYYMLKYSIDMHKNRMDMALRNLKIAYRLAERMAKTDEMGGMCNDFAIIYAIEGQKRRDISFMKKSTAYSIKSYKVMKKAMRMNSLPLIATNIGVKYISSGNVKKAMKYLYEGLLYGIEVDHPVEVPYTKSIIAQMMYDSGNRKCVVSECDAIINHRIVTDILPLAAILKYLSEGGYEWKKKGLIKAKTYMNQGLYQPMVTVLSNLFDDAFMKNDRKLIKKYAEEIKSFIGKVRLRDNTLSSFKTRILYSEASEGKSGAYKELKEIEDTLNMLGLRNKILALAFCGTGEYLLWKGDKNGFKDMKKAFLIAKNLKNPLLMKNILLKMEMYSKRTSFISRELKIAEDMEKRAAQASSIEEFVDYIYKY